MNEEYLKGFFNDNVAPKRSDLTYETWFSKIKDSESYKRGMFENYVSPAGIDATFDEWNAKVFGGNVAPSGNTMRERFGKMVETQKKKSEDSGLPSQLPSQSVSFSEEKKTDDNRTLADRRIFEIDDKIKALEVERRGTLKPVTKTSLSGVAGEPMIARGVQETTTYEPTVRTGQFDYEIAKLKEKRKRIEQFKVADTYFAGQDIDLTTLSIAEEEKRRVAAVVGAGGVLATADPEVAAYNEKRTAIEVMKIDAYMDYLKKTDGGRYNKIVELFTEEGAPIAQGFAGAEGLVAWLKQNAPEGRPQSFFTTLLFGDEGGKGFLEAFYGGAEEVAMTRQVRDVVFEADRYFSNYLSEQTNEVVEVANFLPEQNRTALESVGNYQSILSDTAAKIERLQKDNPAIFSPARTKQQQEINEAANGLKAEKLAVERALAKLQADETNMVLAEEYTNLANAYNAKVEQFNGLVESAKVSGEQGVVEEYNRLLNDYNGAVENIRLATDGIGKEFFDIADRYNGLEGMRATQKILRMDTPFDPVAFIDATRAKEERFRMVEAMTTPTGFMLETVVKPFLEPFVNTSKGALAATPNALAELMFGEDRGNDAIGRFYDALQEAPSARNMLPQIAEAGLFGNENVPAWVSGTAAIAQGFGSVAEFTLAGVTGVKGLQVAGVAPKVASKYGSRLAITATGQAMMVDGLYREALEVGIPRREAAGISLAMSTMLGYTETLVNDADLFAPLSTGFKSRVFTELAENFAKGKGWNSTMLTRAMQSSIAGLSEAGEEVSASLVEGIMKGVVNSVYDEELYEFPDAKELVEVAIIGAVTGYGASAVGNLATRANPYNVSVFLDVIGDEERLNRASAMLARSLTPQEYGNFQDLVTQYQGVLDGYDVAQMTEEERAGVADAVINIRTLEGRIKNSITPDISERQLRPRINALKDYVNGVIERVERVERVETPREEADTAVSQGEQERSNLSIDEIEALRQAELDEAIPYLPFERNQEKDGEYDWMRQQAKEFNADVRKGLLGRIKTQELLLEKAIEENDSEGAEYRKKLIKEAEQELASYDQINAKYDAMVDGLKTNAGDVAIESFAAEPTEVADVTEVMDEPVVGGESVIFSSVKNTASAISVIKPTISEEELQRIYNLMPSLQDDIVDFVDEAMRLGGGSDAVSYRVAREYHKAKADGSNPELVTAVENLLGNVTQQQSGETTPTQPQGRSEQGSAAQATVAEETRPAPQEQVADVADRGAAESVGTGDTAAQGEPARVAKTTTDAKADIERRLGIKLPVKNTALPVSYKTWGDRKSLANQLSSELKGVVERGVSMQEWLDKGYGRQLATWTDETIIEFLEVADMERRRQEELAALEQQSQQGEPARVADPALSDRLLANLDRLEQSLDQFGKETLGANTAIPILFAKGAINVARAGIKAGKAIADVLADIQDYLNKSKWYQSLNDTQKANVNAQIADAIENGTPLTIRATPKQVRRFRDLKRAIEKAQRTDGKVFGILEAMGFGEVAQVSSAIVSKMEAETLNGFLDRFEADLQTLELNPTKSVEDSLMSAVEEFKNEVGRLYEEYMTLEGDEATKKKKFDTTVDEAAQRIEEAVAALPDVDVLERNMMAVYDALEPDMVEAVRDVLPAFLYDIVSELKTAPEGTIADAFKAMYGYRFSDVDSSIGSSTLLRDIQEAAAILETVAAGEKVPTNLQALFTVSSAIEAYRNRVDMTEARNNQRELFMEVVYQIASLFGKNKRAGEKMVAVVGKGIYTRDALARVLRKGMRPLSKWIDSVNTARIIANGQYAQIKTETQEVMRGIKYQPSAKTPAGISAKIARKFKLGIADSLQKNELTQSVYSVLDAMVRYQRMAELNKGFYRGDVRPIPSILKSWNEKKGDTRSKDGYSPYDLSSKYNPKVDTETTPETSLEEDLYEGVWAWLNENGYVSDGVLDWQRVINDMSVPEQNAYGHFNMNYLKMGQYVSATSQWARNTNEPLFDGYTPVDELKLGDATRLTERGSAADIANQLTTPAASAFQPVDGDTFERAQPRPDTPSAAMPRVNRDFERPIVLSTVALFLRNTRDVIRDANVTPAVQRARKVLAFTAAMQKDANREVLNSVESDVLTVGGMVTDVFRPRWQQDAVESKAVNRALDWFVSKVATAMMVRYLTGIVKPIVDTIATAIPALSKWGMKAVYGWMANNNPYSTVPRQLEVLYDKYGFDITQRLGSETDQMATIGSKPLASSTIIQNRNYSKYSVRGSILGAIRSVPKPLGRKGVAQAAFEYKIKGASLARFERGGKGSAAGMVGFADYHVAPAVGYAAMNLRHKQLTGRDFDINEWVDKDFKPKTLTAEQRLILPEIRSAANRAVTEIAGASDPASTAGFVKKTGTEPRIKALKTLLLPFMGFPMNNTIETYQATGMLFSGRKAVGKMNVAFGFDMGDSGLGTRVSGFTEATSRVIAGAAYVTLSLMMGRMVIGAITKTINKLMDEDDEEESVKEQFVRQFGEEYRDIIEAWPNLLVRGLLDAYVSGIPLTGIVDPVNIIGAEKIAPIPYSQEDLQSNRYLRIAYGRVRNERERVEAESFEQELARMTGNALPSVFIKQIAEQPAVQLFVEPMTYAIWYWSLEGERQALKDELPSPERSMLIQSIGAFMLSNPLTKTLMDAENKRLREYKKMYDEHFKGVEEVMSKEMIEAAGTPERETPTR
jgi:hypothetical protein